MNAELIAVGNGAGRVERIEAGSLLLQILRFAQDDRAFLRRIGMAIKVVILIIYRKLHE
jgi:hypothetical protein